MSLKEIQEQARCAAEQLIQAARLEPGMLLVVGCSSSEIGGSRIGTTSSLELAQAVFDGIYPALQTRGIHLAAQCCEHLNRALIVEREAAEKYGLEPVNVVPQPKAGRLVCHHRLRPFPAARRGGKHRRHAGMDIGGTLIGMHLRRVAVPVRLDIDHIGEAILLCARTRPKFVGGSRAVYDDALL